MRRIGTMERAPIAITTPKSTWNRSREKENPAETKVRS